MAMMPGGPGAPNPLLPGVGPRPPRPSPGTSPLVPSPPAPPPGPPAPGGTPPGVGGPPVPAGGGGLAAALKQAGIDLPPDPALEERDLGRRSPRGSTNHIYEIVATDLAYWLETMPKVLARAMKGGPHKQAPFKVPATGKQKYEIFKGKLFNDDGSPNVEGRQELLRRMTPQQYAQVVHIVTREMRRDGGIGEETDDEQR